MSNPTDKFRQGAKDADGTYPESIVLKPGDFILGKIDSYDEAASQFGMRDICVIADEDRGGLRSLWLSDTVLEARFAELQPQIGERIFVKRHEDRKNASGTKYHAYTVRVEGRAKRPKFNRATEVPPEQKAETLEREKRPVLEEEVLAQGSSDTGALAESFKDFPEALDDDGDNSLPF